MAAFCSSFRKNGRGRPGLDLPCTLCGVPYRSHGRGKAAPAPINPPAPSEPKKDSAPKVNEPPKDISSLLSVAPEQPEVDW